MGATNDADRVHIFDTTLRDGEQSPGISLNTQEKVEIADQLARLGVDVIEAGFPITSPGDFEAVQAIAREVEGPIVAGLPRAQSAARRARGARGPVPAGLARAQSADVGTAWGAVRDAARPRIHTFISTSDIHIEHQLMSTREDVKGQARAAVAHARSLCDDVEFSPMDATRAALDLTAGAARRPPTGGRCATTSSSPRWTRRAPTWTSPPRSCRSPSTRARRRSTCP